MERLTQPIKYFGGNRYLAAKIIALMPQHIHYVEPFAGGLAVLLARDPMDERLWLPPHKGVSEVVNDLDSDLVNFWGVLREPGMFEVFRRKCEATPFAKETWKHAERLLDLPDLSPCDRAWAFFVNCRQSRAGMRQDFTSLTRNRLRRGMNGNVSEWIGAVDGLTDVHARLRRVVVENMDALKLIAREDAPGTLHYCDPPYYHSTRTGGGYVHEMSDQQHSELLDLLRQCRGKVMLSGYANPLYDERLRDWNRHDYDLPNQAAGGKTKRRMIESLWCNF